jgi:hypothetical protein
MVTDLGQESFQGLELALGLGLVLFLVKVQARAAAQELVPLLAGLLGQGQGPG